MLYIKYAIRRYVQLCVGNMISKRATSDWDWKEVRRAACLLSPVQTVDETEIRIGTEWHRVEYIQIDSIA